MIFPFTQLLSVSGSTSLNHHKTQLHSLHTQLHIICLTYNCTRLTLNFTIIISSKVHCVSTRSCLRQMVYLFIDDEYQGANSSILEHYLAQTMLAFFNHASPWDSHLISFKNPDLFPSFTPSIQKVWINTPKSSS